MAADAYVTHFCHAVAHEEYDREERETGTNKGTSSGISVSYLVVVLLIFVVRFGIVSCSRVVWLQNKQR